MLCARPPPLCHVLSSPPQLTSSVLCCGPCRAWGTPWRGRAVGVICCGSGCRNRALSSPGLAPLGKEVKGHSRVLGHGRRPWGVTAAPHPSPPPHNGTNSGDRPRFTDAVFQVKRYMMQCKKCIV